MMFLCNIRTSYKKIENKAIIYKLQSWLASGLSYFFCSVSLRNDNNGSGFCTGINIEE